MNVDCLLNWQLLTSQGHEPIIRLVKYGISWKSPWRYSPSVLLSLQHFIIQKNQTDEKWIASQVKEFECDQYFIVARLEEGKPSHVALHTNQSFWYLHSPKMDRHSKGIAKEGSRCRSDSAYTHYRYSAKYTQSYLTLDCPNRLRLPLLKPCAISRRSAKGPIIVVHCL